jgi:uncharacterized membrane protein YhaH (DUF805 family)
MSGSGVARGLRGRANRKEYWLYVGVLAAVGMLAAQVAPVLSLAGALVLVYAQIRRLHDFGRTGWWAVACLLLQVPLAFVLYYSLGEEAALLIGNAPVLAPIAWIGAVPGHPHENRFGPPRSQRRLEDVFG